MATGDYRFDDTVADSTTGSVTGTAEALSGDLDTLTSAVEGLAGSWEGGEYDIYKGVFDAFHAAAENARASLTNIVKAVEGQKTATGEFKTAIREALG
ncbi:WXG100 family type VII secretion target [Dietzia cercidiphylli]|uniref:WXG100 family type VII secretion target n=1 Tax=Dietzia cercidiphylli TaxID=498199 RepID=UPI00223A8AB2|nr:WXG100 family type VII secretion target [Dietzia cercidiphylli]MCT1515384.1 WXG100 family type VII secretion target [Dietzia cercidiphylli]